MDDHARNWGIVVGRVAVLEGGRNVELRSRSSVIRDRQACTRRMCGPAQSNDTTVSALPDSRGRIHDCTGLRTVGIVRWGSDG